MFEDNTSGFEDKPSGNLFSGETPSRDFPGQDRPSQDWITAYCDGGSRGNPGPAGYGVFIEGPKGEKLAELSEFLGKATNNVAEYSALLGALEWTLQSTHRRLRVVADSELLVKQIQGRYKVASPDLRPLYDEAKRRIAKLDGFRIEHVLRGKNQRADRLANAAMDRGMGRAAKSTPAAPSFAPAVGAKGGKQPAPQPLKGYVKGGVVHLLEGELPDGVFVKVTPDRQ
jgi:probable phosphoglycerate mutase